MIRVYFYAFHLMQIHLNVLSYIDILTVPTLKIIK